MPDRQNLLDQIDRLDQQATKGPWIIDSIESGEHALFVDEDNPGYGHLGAASSTVASFLLAKNADFIALSRTALPQLAKALGAVEQECRRMAVESSGSSDMWDNGRRAAINQICQAITDTMGADDA